MTHLYTQKNIIYFIYIIKLSFLTTIPLKIMTMKKRLKKYSCLTF